MCAASPAVQRGDMHALLRLPQHSAERIAVECKCAIQVGANPAVCFATFGCAVARAIEVMFAAAKHSDAFCNVAREQPGALAQILVCHRPAWSEMIGERVWEPAAPVA